MAVTVSVVPRSRSVDATVVLVGGHESGAGRELGPSARSAAAAAIRAAGPGRELVTAVRGALAASARPVCVIPMTLGRDPGLVAEAARALRWLSAGSAPGRLALAEPFGGVGHLVGWLRAACARALTAAGQPTAMLVTAPAAEPHAEPEP